MGPIGAESRVITEPSYNGLKGTKENKIFSLTIFFSETIARRKTAPGSLERALRALHAHIFFMKIGPIGADYNGLKGTKEKKLFSLTIFFSETIAPRKTGPGSLERALRALHAHIFFIKIGPIGADTEKNRTGINRTGVVGKGSSRPTRPYFFYQDRTNRSRVITINRTGVIGKGSSRPTRPYFFYQDRTNRSRVITEPSYNGLKGTKEKKLFSLTIFFSETIAPRKTGPGSLERALRALHAHIFFIKIGPIGAESRVITEPSYNGLKGTKEKKLFSLTIFFSETIAPRKTGPGSLERALRALHAHIFFIKIGPIGAESRVITEPSYNGLKGTKENKIFSLTIFFSETIAPRKTGPGSLERALRALHAHIFFIKIGPIGAEKTGPGSLERALRALHAHIFFIKIGPIGAEKTGPGSLERALRALHAHIFFIKIGPIGANYNGLKGTKEKKLFSLTIFFSETIAPRKTVPGSLERALRALHAHIFFIKIGPIGAESRVITEPSYNGLKGTKEKKIFSLTIFFSETIARRKTGPGSLERALRALHAHIFFIKIGPIGAESRVITEPSYNGLKGTKEKKIFSLTIFFSETIARRKTGPGSLERALRALHAHIFFIKIGPIGAEKTGPGSLERALRALHAHIFFIKIGPIGADTEKNRTGVIGKGSSRPTRPYFFYQDRTNRSRVITEPSYNGLKGTKEKKIFSLTIFFSETIARRKTGPGSLERALRALHAHIFFIKIGPIGADTEKNRTGVIGKGSSRPTRPYFLYQDRTNRSRVITEPSYNGLKGTKEKKLFSLTIFFSETIAPRKTGPGSLERALRALHAHIFFIKIGPIGAEKTGPGSLERALRALQAHIFFIKIGPIGADYNGLKGTKENKIFSLTIFFSETIAPRKTGPGSLERALRALHAHIFFIKIGPIGAEKTGPGSLERALRALHAHIFFIKIGPIGADYNGLKGTKEKKLFSLTIFFSETIAPRKTGPGSLERALRALHAHIFFIKIGPIGAEKTGPGSLERALRALHAHIFFIKIGPIGAESRVITEPSYNGLKGTKEKKIFSLTIFFSETIARRKTGPGSLERALRALHAHIFFIKIGPIGAEKTGPGSLERALRALHAHIFFIKIGPIGADTEKNRTGVIGKGSSRPTRPYFFYQDRTNRSRVITEPSYNGLKGTKEKKIFSLTIFFSETIARRKTGPGSLERALRALHAHIFFIKIGPIGADTEKNRTGVIGKGSSRPTRPYFLYQDRTNRSRVITEPSYNGLKGTKEKKLFSLTIFFSETIAPRKTGPGSLERALRALHAHIFFIKIGPIGAEKTGPGSLERALRALQAHIFFIKIGPIGADYNGLKGTKENKIFSLTIFFSETIAPRKTGPGSLERALRALHAHIFFIKIGPIGAEKTGPGSLERALRALHAHIFFIKIGPIGADYNGLKGTKEKKLFSLTIFFSETIAPRKTGPGSLERALRALHAHIFFIKIGPIGADTEKNRTGVIGKGSSRPTRPYFFYQDRTNRSRVITEPSYNGLKGTKENKIFSLTIFFSETIAPRKTGPGSLERALRALHAHIFFIKIGPIGADTEKNRTGVIGKGSSRPTRPYFFYQDRTNRSRVITEPSYNGLKGTKENKIFSLTIFFSETIAPRKTGPGSLERALRALHAHIFFIKIGPIGAETNRSRVITEPSYNGLKGTKEKKLFSLTIFFSETIAPRKTGPGSLERALRALHAHIFFIKIGPIGAESRVITEPSYNGLKGTKEKKIFSLTIFFSETIARRKTGPGSLERALRALHAHIFFIKIGPIGADTSKNRTGVIGKGSSRPTRPYFFYQDRTNRSRVITGTKENKIFSLTIFFSETIAPRKTGPGSLERALRALHAHIFFIKIGPIGAESRVITEPSYNGLKGTKEKKIFSLTIFFSETIARRKTGPGSLERALRALHAHIFFIKIGPIGAEKTGPGSLERALRALHAHIFFIKIGPIGADTEKNRTGVIGKGSSRPTRPYFLYQDRTNRSRVITINRTGVNGKGSSRPTRPYFFYQDRTNRSRVITINRTGVNGKGSSRPTRPYFFYQDRTNRSRVITHVEKPHQGHWKGLFAPYTPIFFLSRSDQYEPSYNGLKGTKENKIFSLTIFFSETIAPRKTGPGSLERALRALHAHIFFIKIGPIGAEL
ncbi:LOW QUALITY PROTEIN: hypothetical protein V1477_004489 [Vespula maculifrons]|uniref:Uncharacterized protein n=1 Tax=Vespula maculifrons TaxID=7453 RepID=A0ABD2CMW3_VESMC